MRESLRPSHAVLGVVWHTFAMPATDSDNKVETTDPKPEDTNCDDNPAKIDSPSRPREIGGRDGPDPTRYGDWEKAGRCIDF